MINRYTLLFGALAVLFAGYAVWWHGEARRVETALPGVLAGALPEGATLGHGAPEVGGFPFRINVRLPDVRIEWDGGQLITESLTAIFQPTTRDHVILHLDAPMAFDIDGIAGTVAAERALASMIGYEGGRLRIDADAMNVTLERAGAPPLTAARLQGHVIAAPDERGVSLAVRGLSPATAATGRLADLLARYGERRADGTLDLSVDVKDGVYHARGRPLPAGEAGPLEALLGGG
jgi:hypothetical protein